MWQIKLPDVAVESPVVIALIEERVGVINGVVLSAVTGAVDAVVVNRTVGVVSDSMVKVVGTVVNSVNRNYLRG